MAEDEVDLKDVEMKYIISLSIVGTLVIILLILVFVLLYLKLKQRHQASWSITDQDRYCKCPLFIGQSPPLQNKYDINDKLNYDQVLITKYQPCVTVNDHSPVDKNVFFPDENKNKDYNITDMKQPYIKGNGWADLWRNGCFHMNIMFCVRSLHSINHSGQWKNIFFQSLYDSVQPRMYKDAYYGISILIPIYLCYCCVFCDVFDWNLYVWTHSSMMVAVAKLTVILCQHFVIEHQKIDIGETFLHKKALKIRSDFLINLMFNHIHVHVRWYSLSTSAVIHYCWCCYY